MSEEKIPDVLYKYYPAERWKNVFKDWTIRFTPPEEFNDPFECKPYHDSIFEKNLFNNSLRRDDLFKVAKFFSGAHNSGYPCIPGFSGKQVNTTTALYKINEIVDSCIGPNSKSLLEEAGDNISKSVGILSISEDMRNILMWAHYAQSHTGFVVGIKVSADFLLKQPTKILPARFPHKAIYTSARNRKFWKSPGTVLDDYLYIKGKQWAYEKEWRVWVSIEKDDRYIWVSGAKRGVVSFSPDCIASLVFGACMSDSHIQARCRHIRSQPDCAHIKLQRARLDESRYELVIEEIEPSFYEKP